MISLAPDYVRVFIEKDRPFDEVTESIRSALQICRVNALPAAIVVSEQHSLDWRSSLRVAIKFVATRWPMPDIKLALVVVNADERTGDEVRQVATDAGFECRIFNQERQAIAWVIRGGGGGE